MAMFAMVTPAEAKYSYTFAGHPAVYYTNADIVQWLRPYIDHIEYDTAYGSKHGYGARMYFTTTGKLYAASTTSDSMARAMAKYVMSMPEWAPERSENSVTKEIAWHARTYRYQVDIEYYYEDLTSWYDIFWKNV